MSRWARRPRASRAKPGPALSVGIATVTEAGTQPILPFATPHARLRLSARSTTLRCHAALGPGSGAGAARSCGVWRPPRASRCCSPSSQHRIVLGAGRPSVAVAGRARALRVCPEPGGELHPPPHRRRTADLERRNRRRRCRWSQPRGVLSGAPLRRTGAVRTTPPISPPSMPLTRAVSDGNGPSTATNNPPLYYLVAAVRLSHRPRRHRLRASVRDPPLRGAAAPVDNDRGLAAGR